MKMIKRYLILAGVVIVIIAIAAGGLFLFFKGDFSKKEDTTERDMAQLQEQVLSISELATIKYDYTSVINSSNGRNVGSWTIPFSKKTIIAVLDGTMKIGIDVSKIDFPKIPTPTEDGEPQVVTITIPKATVLDHYPRDQRVLEEKDGFLNKSTAADYIIDVALALQEMEEKAIADGLLERAEEEARQIIERLVRVFPVEGYTIEVAVAEAAA